METIRFTKPYKAKIYQNKFLKDYGYVPEIFIISGKKKKWYEIVKPSGLVKK
jgi:hypothetical protein